MMFGLAFVTGTLPLTRDVFLSTELMSERLLSAAVDSAVVVCMPSVALTSTVFLSSPSDTRGLVAAAGLALGAQPIASSHAPPHSARRVSVFEISTVSALYRQSLQFADEFVILTSDSYSMITTLSPSASSA